jgi:hypothetical protein
MKNKIDLTIDSSRPDLEVIPRLPGAYIIKNGKPEPDLNDEAMAERNKKSEISNQKSDEKKLDDVEAEKPINDN